MARIDDYRATLRALPKDEWEKFLLAESRLPGPRGNLELAHAAAVEGDPRQLAAWAAWDAAGAPENSPRCFVAFCGTLGLGVALGGAGARERARPLRALRAAAADPRWRVREAAATALQLFGDADIDGLLAVAEDWAAGGPLEQRAAAAAVCEPRLLRDPAVAHRVLAVLDRITAALAAAAPSARDEAHRVLEKGLGYCWSVAAAAAPKAGLPMMERWISGGNPAVVRVIKANLAKTRLARADAAWVARMKKRYLGKSRG